MFEQFELPEPIDNPSAGEIFTPEAPDASKPILDNGSYYFVREENASPDLVLDADAANFDLFRQDINNVYDRVQAYQRFGLIRIPEPAFISGRNTITNPIMKTYSDELMCSVYLEKFDGVPLVEPDFAGAVPLATQKKEDYYVYVDPKEYNRSISPPPAGAILGENSRPLFSTYLEERFLPADDLSYYPSHNFRINLANQGKSPEDSQFDKEYVHFKTNYNFFQFPYEATINGVDEKAIPNLYTYMATLEGKEKGLAFSTVEDETNLNPDYFQSTVTFNKFWTHASLDNSVANLSAPNKGIGQTNSLENSPLQRYFNDWADAVETAPGAISIDQDQPQAANQAPVTGLAGVIADWRRIFVPDLSADGMLRYNKFSDFFPMNVEFFFTTDPNKSFFTMLKETGHEAFMLSWISQLASAETTRYVEFEGDEYKNFVSRLNYSFEDYLNQALEPVQLGEDVTLLPPGIEDLIYLGKIDNNLKPIAPISKYIKVISSTAALQSKVKEFIEGKLLSYQDILNGETCYNETFFYEVEKLSSTAGGAIGPTLQSFFFPNDEQKTINFIDTQVKYSTGYVYRIWKWQIVVGTDYSPRMKNTYFNGQGSSFNEEGQLEIFPSNHPFHQGKEPPEPGDEGYMMGELEVLLTPNVRIVRVPYYNVVETNQEGVLPIHTPTIILDSPPLYPEIEFVPLIKERDSLIINIKDTIGSYRDYAVPLNTNEEETLFGDEMMFEMMLNQQLKNELNLPPEELANLNIETNKLKFKSDDLAQAFEIYIIEKKPTSYEDFSDALYETVPGPNYAYKVKLDFNKKYYFTFRTLDKHSNFSNPTPIYEIELVEESGMSYPAMNILDLEEENKKLAESLDSHSYTKSGKMFLCINPSHDQADLLSNLVNREEEAETAMDLLPISLGDVEGESVFGKKFKIRIRSKKTGKVIDINFTPENVTTQQHITADDKFGD